MGKTNHNAYAEKRPKPEDERGDIIELEPWEDEALTEAVETVNAQMRAEAEAGTPAGRLRAVLAAVATEYGNEEPQGDNELTEEDRKKLDAILAEANAQTEDFSEVNTQTAPMKPMGGP